MKKRIIATILCAVALVSVLSFISCKDDKEDNLNDKYLLLVNKTNTIGANYVPENLVSVNSAYTNGGKSIELESTTAAQVVKMLDAMRADGITNASITSGYRSYSYQTTLFNKYCAEEREAHPDWNEDKVKAYVQTYSALPGTSEHHTGLCVDLITTEMTNLWNYGSETPSNPYDKGFAETSAFTWLKANAHKYGFVLRYPENKTGITGYSYESWHYRYVGVEHATKMYEQGICLEEYLAS